MVVETVSEVSARELPAGSVVWGAAFPGGIPVLDREVDPGHGVSVIPGLRMSERV